MLCFLFFFLFKFSIASQAEYQIASTSMRISDKSQAFTGTGLAYSSLYLVSFLIKNPPDPFRNRFL